MNSTTATMALMNPFESKFLALRAMFYLVTPDETSYQYLDHVPEFVFLASPYFFVMLALETVILFLQGKELPRVNDSINSISHGVLSQLHNFLFRHVELVVYAWIYTHYSVVELPWDMAGTWLAAFIGVDFVYYWFHRWSHESNIIWASHQVHHSSEDYNLSTALRQSLMQKYYSMTLNFAMALFIPPPAFYVHVQLNLLYQFWIHTEVVRTIGPLEYILNTPSHHRVHHGRNPYCIDKNYGGTLIIWDRIFNTFQAEDEKVVYGLIHTNQFWNPLYGQFHHYLHILGMVGQRQRLTNKVWTVVKGPGWAPGKPWTGWPEDIPEVENPVVRYDSNLPSWASLYVLIHFVGMTGMYNVLLLSKQAFSALTALGCVAYFVYSITVFGALFDHWKYSGFMEFARCAIVVGLLPYFTGPITLELTFTAAVYSFYFLSAILWLGLTLTQYQLHVIKKKVN